MDDLSPRQKDCYLFIKQFVDKNGYPPTHQEIVTEFRLKNPNSIYSAMNVLIEKGYLGKTPYKTRGIKVLK